MGMARDAEMLAKERILNKGRSGVSTGAGDIPVDGLMDCGGG